MVEPEPLPLTANRRVTIGVGLRRWGMTALALFATGYILGRLHHSGISSADQVRHDSATVADAAKDEEARATRKELWRVVDSMQVELDSAQARQARAEAVHDDKAAAVRAAVAAVLASLPPSDTGAQRRGRELLAAVEARDSAAARERRQAAVTLAQANHIADSLRAGARRDSMTIDTLRHDRDAAERREQNLIAKDRAWRVAVTLGPGVALMPRAGSPSPVEVRFAPVQVTVGVSREIRLPRLFPRV